MFQRWGFLLSEIWVLLALAALLGLFVGWLIWSRREGDSIHGKEADGLRSALEACNAKGRDQAARIASLEADLAASGAKAAALPAASVRGDLNGSTAAPAETAAMAAPASLMPSPVADSAVAAAPSAADKPKGLEKARGGKADDLKMIKGIGPKLEILCNKLGFFHFDQIAAWTAKEIAWVDDNLEGFKGRVTRDEWVKQAAILAKGGTTEFANRVKDGDVY